MLAHGPRPSSRMARLAALAITMAATMAVTMAATMAVTGCDPAPAPPRDGKAASKTPADDPSPSPSPSTTPMPTPPPDLSASAIPIEDVAKYPSPGTAIPGAIRISPDGKSVTYLMSPDGSLTRQLMATDLATGEARVVFTPPEGGATEANLSPEEKLQRERRRERGLGVTRYAWARDADRMLVPVRGDLWIQDGLAGKPRKAVDATDHPALDPRLSRDGTKLAYVSDAEVYVVDLDGDGKSRQITSGARGTGRTHGLAEYIAQEEMGRYSGYWWSHDASRIAYTEVDETHIPTWRIAHQGRDTPSWEDHGYPFAGEPNAKVRLGVVAAKGGKTVWMDVGMEGEPADDLYLARVHWMPSGELLAEIENRAQSRLDLVRFDPKTGARTVLLTERSEVWINLHSAFRPLEKATGAAAGGFIWASEASGFRHLQVRAADGTKLVDLTSGDWMVDGLSALDEDDGFVYFTATKDGPTTKNLYRVPLAGGEVTRLTPEPGMHGGAVSAKHNLFVDVHSTLAAPPTVAVRKVDGGEVVRALTIEPDPRVAKLGLTPPRLVTVKTKDGVTLHGAVYEPPKGTARAPYPTIVSVYGGPHAQRVTESWGMTVDMRAQFLASRGYLVFKLDNRGSARRGLAFEGAIRHDMGNLEVADQVEGVEWLVAEGLADKSRVGMYGWSYGGYMSAMALARAPETFVAAVAGAPVTHWDGYDTHYTERYMGTPKGNPKGYADSAVMAHLDGMVGKLMIVHGLIDENVHFRHAARLIQALVSAGKDHELLMFPDERHMPRKEADRVYMERRMLRFFDEALAAPAEAPLSVR
ncbi:MAG: S9 family peptidase [Myxococcota bacterium]